MATEAFVHAPLGSPRSFRLLELLPSRSFNSTVSCQILEADLDDDHPQYEALSYAWGTPTPGPSVSIGKKAVPVTANCLEALKHLRLGLRPRLLWIDAICIDQGKGDKSTHERSHQVELMGEIYSKAQTVLVWLGASESKAARKIRRRKLLARIMRPTKLCFTGGLLQRGLDEAMVVPRDGIFEPKYHEMALMLRNDWWRRAWTFQEQGLARRCIAFHGWQSILMEDLLRSTSQGHLLPTEFGSRLLPPIYNSEAHSLHLHFRFLHERYKSLAELRPTRPVLDTMAKITLNAAFCLETLLPVDRIYALYAMLVMCDLPLPIPDYSKPFEVVYEETAWAWIESRQNLSIIQMAARPNQIPNLPSWVPAYHLSSGVYRTNLLVGPKYFSWDSYTPRDDPRAASIGTEHSPGVLKVMGRHIGAVTFRSTITEAGTEDNVAILREICWHVFHKISTRNESGYDEALREMFRTLAFVEPHKREVPDGYDSGFSVFRAWFVAMVCKSPDFAGSQEGVLLAESPLAAEYKQVAGGSENMESVYDWMNLYILGLQFHAFCVFDNGMMGMAKYWCEDGDEVFLLRGADCPFVLRREGASYRLVGPVYVYRLHEEEPWSFDGDDMRTITLI